MGAETPEIKVEKKIELQDANLESFNAEIDRVGPDKGQIHPVDFLNKHESLLRENVNTLCELIKNLHKKRFWTEDVLNKILDICKEHLQKTDAQKNILKIADAINILKYDTEETIELDQEEDEKKPEEKDPEDVRWDAISPPLRKFVRISEEKLGEAIARDLKKIKELGDNEFLKISENLCSASRVIREETLNRLLYLEKKPFENIVIFKQTIKNLITSQRIYPDTETLNVINIVLKNNRDLMESDPETKDEVEKLIRGAKIDKLITNIRKREKREKEMEDERNKIAEISWKNMEEIKKLADDGEYEEALDRISKMLKVTEINEDFLEILDECITEITDKGLEFKDDGDYTKAISCFEFILKRIPSSRQAIENLAICSFLKNQKDLGTLEGPPDPTKPAPKKTKISEYDLEYDMGKVFDNLRIGETDIAIIILKGLNKKSPDNPGIIHCLSLCHMMEAQKYMTEINEGINNTENIKEYEKVLKVMPLLTKFLVEMNKSLKLQKYMADNEIGKDFVEESRIFTSFTDALKICKMISAPCIAKLEKWLKSPDSTLSAEEKKTLAEFAKAEADLIASYYPQRKFSMWDLINVATVDENKKHLIEGADGIPVKIDTVGRMEAGMDKMDAESRIVLLASLTADREFINASKELVGIVRRYKEENRLSPDYEKAFLAFKNNLTRLILEGGDNEKFGKIAMDTLPLMATEEQFLQLAKLKINEPEESDLPKKRWDEESIDPIIEMTMNMNSLKSYMASIRLDPANPGNYKAMFAFLKKIGLGDICKDYESEILRNDPVFVNDPEKFSVKLYENILNKIKLQTSLIQPKESTLMEAESARIQSGDINITLQPTVQPTAKNMYDTETQSGKGAELGGVMLNLSMSFEAIEALFKKMFG